MPGGSPSLKERKKETSPAASNPSGIYYTGLVELFIASEVEEPNEKNNIRRATASTPDAVFSSDRLHVFCVYTVHILKPFKSTGHLHTYHLQQHLAF